MLRPTTLLVLGTTVAAQAAPAAADRVSTAMEQAARCATAVVDAGATVGMVVGMRCGERVEIRGYGHTAPDSQVTPNADTVYEKVDGELIRRLIEPQRSVIARLRASDAIRQLRALRSPDRQNRSGVVVALREHNAKMILGATRFETRQRFASKCDPVHLRGDAIDCLDFDESNRHRITD